MFLLIAEFTHLFGHLVVPELKGTFFYEIGMQFHHVKWEGLHFWDLIQPFFMFIVGVAIPFGSGTAGEYPVVADVTGDGHANIVVGSNAYYGGTFGIRI